MNLAEVEAKLIAEGFSEELFSQFQTNLKRVRGSYNKCQHCYTTAYSLKEQDSDHAIRMIRYGLDNFAEQWIDFYRSYENLAGIYVRLKRYADARVCYLAELDKMVEFDAGRYADALAVNLIFAELHCEEFKYTDNLRKYFNIAKPDTIKAGFLRRDKYYYALAYLLILLHDQNVQCAQRVYTEVICILNGTDSNFTDSILRRHRYVNEACATVESLSYLESVSSLLHQK